MQVPRLFAAKGQDNLKKRSGSSGGSALAPCLSRDMVDLTAQLSWTAKAAGGRELISNPSSSSWQGLKNHHTSQVCSGKK